MANKVLYENTCNITCTDNDIVKEAEVLNFLPGKSLTVTINRQVKLSIVYHESATKKFYIGNMTGLEFTTPGPKEVITKEGRG